MTVLRSAEGGFPWKLLTWAVRILTLSSPKLEMSKGIMTLSYDRTELSWVTFRPPADSPKMTLS